MNPTYEWGRAFIEFVHQFRSPVLDSFFLAVTAMGDEIFFLLMLPFIVWCLDYTVGIRVTLFMVFSYYINIDLKHWILAPRPYQVYPELLVIESEGYGMPSGHAQLAASVWGALAVWLRRAWAWIAAAVLMLLIGFSRIYLAVHFPMQVLAGWAVGALLLTAYSAGHEKLTAWLARLSMATQIGLVVGLSVAMLLINASDDAFSTVGFILGIGTGLPVAVRYAPYRVADSWGKRLLCFAVGLVVLFALYLGLSAAFPDEGEALYTPLRFVRYMSLGLWASLGAPWVFQKLKLGAEN